MADESSGNAPDADVERRARLERLISTYWPGLVTYSTQLMDGDRARAEDVVQETFIRAWLQIDRLTPDHGSVNGWLRRVAHNVAVDKTRMRKARPAEVELSQATDTYQAQRGNAVDDLLSALVVDRILAAAGPEHRAVLVQVFVHDRTSVQAAAALGIPVGTVKSRLHYALRRLRADQEMHRLLAG